MCLAILILFFISDARIFGSFFVPIECNINFWQSAEFIWMASIKWNSSCWIFEQLSDSILHLFITLGILLILGVLNIFLSTFWVYNSTICLSYFHFFSFWILASLVDRIPGANSMGYLFSYNFKTLLSFCIIIYLILHTVRLFF